MLGCSVGQLANEGFTLKELKYARNYFRDRDIECELINLRNYLPDSYNDDTINDDINAYILIARGGLNALIKPNTSIDFFDEQSTLDVDKKAFMYGRVVNKLARHNLCFANEAQEPDYENKMGRVIAFDTCPLLNKVRSKLHRVVGEKARGLFAEGNYYHAPPQPSGISYHGDTERRTVIGIRTGASLPLHFHWFHNSTAIGETCKLLLNDGDIYIMSEKAVGQDWKKKKIITLRHAAGSAKYLALPIKKK